MPKIKPPPPQLPAFDTPFIETMNERWRGLLAHLNDLTAEASKAIAQSRIQRETLAEARKASASIREQAAALRAQRSKSGSKKSR
ncbi:MAG TPA: hypothetical protein VEL79_14440 [Vicinamibacterales bacterium]|nr:hypothetical protein [Vicinamibacterales bacterium]